MDIKQIEFIKNNKPKDMSIPELAEKSDISVITLRRMLNPNSGYNPTMKTLTKLATPLGLTAQEILAAKDFDDDMYLGVSGYIDFLGEITRIKSKKDLDKIYNEICAKVQAPKAAEKIEKEEKAIIKKQSKSPIDIASINFFEGLDTEIYDTSKVSTWSFRKSDDVVEGEANDLGNMCKGFEFDVCGEHFFNSECAYIVGMFSQNDPQSIKIQRELQASDNGYSAKKDIRHKYEVRGLNRKDWNEFNVEWMKYVVWQKCKQNKAFQKRLSRIPSNAIIVENSTHQKKRQNDTSAFWGARNYELEKKRDVVELAAEVKNYKLTKKEIEAEKMKARNTIHHFGVWVGNNCMGKILTICKHCLDNATEPNIDYDLLRSKQIYLFGKLLTFDDAPKAQETRFPEPTEPLKAKTKEMPTRRKKSSQEVRN